MEGKTMGDNSQMQSSNSGISSLPMEILDTIFCQIDDPNDVIRCGKVCHDWNSLLQIRITSAYFQLILPKLVPYLSADDLLRCSTVSKDWNRWTDTSVRDLRKNAFWIVDTCHSCYRVPHLMMIQKQEHIDDEDDEIQNPTVQIEQLLAEKEKHGSYRFDNPLVYRHVFIRQSPPESTNEREDEEEAFYQLLLKFFELFGQYIYHLELDCFPFNPLHVRMMRMLVMILSKTPNLQDLRLDFSWVFYNVTDAAHEQQLDDFLKVSPLPNSTLRKLRMDFVPTKTMELLMERYGNQLVFVDNFFQIPITKLIEGGVTFQTIQVLRGVVHGFEADMYNLDSITNILRILKSTLAEVDITLVGDFVYTASSFANFFHAIQAYQPGIKKFRLSCEKDPLH